MSSGLPAFAYSLFHNVKASSKSLATVSTFSSFLLASPVAVGGGGEVVVGAGVVPGGVAVAVGVAGVVAAHDASKPLMVGSDNPNALAQTINCLRLSLLCE